MWFPAWTFFLLAIVMLVLGTISGTIENCGNDCSDGGALKVGAAIFAAGGFLLLFRGLLGKPALRAHCYGCGATTEVRRDDMAEDLEAAGWTSAQGQTFCPDCTAARATPAPPPPSADR